MCSKKTCSILFKGLINIMAKTYNNLYEKICSFENIHLAYLKARKNKRYKKEVLEFSANLESNLVLIQNILINKIYIPSKYRYFKVYEPKERLIAALPFFDRIIHHALCNILDPIFEKRFIYDSYACRVNKGILKGINRTTQFLRSAVHKYGINNIYCLKGDISKYFPSISHKILMNIIKKRIKCQETLWLIDRILNSEGLFQNYGLPIGNLTSQLWANIYLNELDHFCKNILKQKFYIRFMDDFIILHNYKNYLRIILNKIQNFVNNKLKLILNIKTQLFPVTKRCIDFLGYRIMFDYRILRKTNITRIKNRFKKFEKLLFQNNISLKLIKASILSWLGHCKHADTYNLKKNIFLRFSFLNYFESGKSL